MKTTAEQRAKMREILSSGPWTDFYRLGWQPVVDLLDDLDAAEKRIAELEGLADAYRAQNEELDLRIAELKATQEEARVAQAIRGWIR